MINDLARNLTLQVKLDFVLPLVREAIEQFCESKVCDSTIRVVKSALDIMLGLFTDKDFCNIIYPDFLQTIDPIEN